MKKLTKQELKLIKANAVRIAEMSVMRTTRRPPAPLTEAEIRASFSFIDDPEELKKIIKKITKRQKKRVVEISVHPNGTATLRRKNG